MSCIQKILFVIVLATITISCNPSSSTANAPAAFTQEERMLARAEAAELDTKYSPPPGDLLSHHASGFAKILCSAVFITGLDFEFAAENIGYFSAPYDEREKFAGKILDEENKAVHVVLPDGTKRTAKYYGDQGCICLPPGQGEPFFEPVAIKSSLPDPAITPWPMGDLLPDDAFPPQLDKAKIRQATDVVFKNPNGMAAAFIATWKGRIVAERYRDGITMHTPLESWSMGKSLTATFMGVLIQQDVYTLNQPAPIPEWQGGNDPRAKIRISDILRMSSGLRFRAPQDPDFDPEMGYPDHLYVYTGSVNSFRYAANRPQQWPPNTIGRYRNSDPVLINYLVRLGVEGRSEEYLSFPQRSLFDKIGVRNMIMETDPYGNLLLQGYEFSTVRDWARIGNLYLQEGNWNGEQIIPKSFVKFARTLAPAWVADGRPIYGGFFWINGTKRWPIPEDAYFMAGAGGQYTVIIPSHDLVVVKLSHYKGGGPGAEGFSKALGMLVEAVPQQ